jgi:serine/threonine-protein kinase
MELLEGVDLARLLRDRGEPLEIAEAIDYVLQACEALAEAHALGIVHRDLKPENLFVCRRVDGTVFVKVIDFGISSGVEITIDGCSPDQAPVKVEMMGSPAYMAPEQVTDFEAVDARADVWSLGAILYELLTNVLIHDETSIGVLLAKVRYCPVTPARARRPDLPEALDALILRCLERDRDRRVQDVSELAAELLPFADERSRASVARIRGFALRQRLV